MSVRAAVGSSQVAMLMSRCFVLLGMALLAGCRFWYKPIPVANAIGEERTLLAGDSVNVYRADRFEVYGPNGESVYDGYEQLNRAYRAFDRYFGGTHAQLAFVLEKDSIRPLDNATRKAFRDRGLILVQYVRPRGMRTRPRYGALDYGGILWPIAPTAARHLLADFGQSHGGKVALGDSATLDLFPVWYRAAVMRLVGDATSPGKDLEYVREKRNELIPLRELLPLVQPVASDSLIDPVRSGDADDFTKKVVAQSGTLARYLVEREGPSVIGMLGRGYVSRRSLADMMSEFKSVPTTIPELERRWLIWVDTREN